MNSEQSACSGTECCEQSLVYACSCIKLHGNYNGQWKSYCRGYTLTRTK